MTKLLRGLGALIVIGAILVGVPVLLILIAGNPLPTSAQWQAIFSLTPRLRIRDPDDESAAAAVLARVVGIRGPAALGDRRREFRGVRPGRESVRSEGNSAWPHPSSQRSR